MARTEIGTLTGCLEAMGRRTGSVSHGQREQVIEREWLTRATGEG